MSLAIYLDHAASTPLASEARRAMVEALTETGNASSMHQAGRRTRTLVDQARAQLAEVVGCTPGEVVFTSGGTEANNLALRGAVSRWRPRGRHVITTSIEHEAVVAVCEQLAELGQIDLTVVGCDGGARVDPQEVAAGVRADTVLVSVMAVNNEVGAIQDVASIATAVRERNPHTLIHSDGAQALGRIPLDVTTLGVDLLTLSAHKAYGPKGAGALIVRRGVFLTDQMSGGGQERGRRSGTENVPAIVGFGVAALRAESRREAEMQRQAVLARRLRERVIDDVEGALLCGSALNSVANIVTVALPQLPSEVMVTALDRRGICVSGGSACSSGATLPSHVLEAMGVSDPHRRGPLRFSLGEDTTEKDVDAALSALAEITRGATVV